MWPDRRLIDLFKIEFPIVQAPMAGVQDADIMIGAATGGALPSLPCAAEKLGKIDFTNLWAGQAVRFGREMPAAELTHWQG